MSSQAPTRPPVTHGFTLVELMVVVAIIGLLAAISVPMFLRFQAKSKQAEAKTNLKAIFTGQKGLYAQQERYSTFAGEVSFAPERGNRYYYQLSELCGAEEDRSVAAPVQTGDQCRIAADVLRHGAGFATATLVIMGAAAVDFTGAGAGVPNFMAAGLHGACPECGFAAFAVGNVDVDLGVDVQWVSSEWTMVTATPCASEVLLGVAGESHIARNDVNCE